MVQLVSSGLIVLGDLNIMVNKDVVIEHCSIGAGHPPFIVAELSGNHGQDFAQAENMIRAAAATGAHAIKLQTYTAESMTLDCSAGDFVISEKDNLWCGERLYDLYQRAATPYEWHQPLFALAKDLGLIAFSSPFDCQAVDFLTDLDVPCFKIASFELTDLPLIAHAASKQKPLIMSTGMATLEEIDAAVRCARKNGCDDIILLKCTSTYPADPASCNLRTIPHLAQAFNCPVGLSDHTRGSGVPIASVALGATVIEKHFVLDRTAGGVDAEFSIEPAELAQLVQETECAWRAVGRVVYGGGPDEEKSKRYRRSIFISRDVEAGESVTADNIKIVRPASGLAPEYYSVVLGRKFQTALPKGTPLDWQYL